MAHKQQQEFLQSVKERFPERFKDCRVLDVGSLDINGNSKFLFEGEYKYLGIDIGWGRNVDVVIRGHEFRDLEGFNIVMNLECAEHDEYWDKTFRNCIHLLKPGGLLLFTCATEGRQEHGTRRTTPQDSPFTSQLENDYYKNLTEEHIKNVITLDYWFEKYEFSVNDGTKDLYLFAIKRNHY